MFLKACAHFLASVGGAKIHLLEAGPVMAGSRILPTQLTAHEQLTAAVMNSSQLTFMNARASAYASFWKSVEIFLYGLS